MMPLLLNINNLIAGMKPFNFAVSFFRRTALLVIFLNVACIGNNAIPDQNENFNKKYAKDLESVKASRVEPKGEKTGSDAKLNFTAPLEQDPARYTNSNITIPEFYSSQQFANQIPPSAGFTSQKEMFENSYNPTITAPFRKIGAEFDVIEVPKKDAYGIKSTMDEKEYFLVSRKWLQSNVDKINAEKNSTDIRNSETLISEQQKLKRQAKMFKIFGHESVTVKEDEKGTTSGGYGDYVQKSKKSSGNKASKKDSKSTPTN